MHGSRSVVLKTLLKKRREYNDRNMTDYPSAGLVLQGLLLTLVRAVFVVSAIPAGTAKMKLAWGHALGWHDGHWRARGALCREGERFTTT